MHLQRKLDNTYTIMVKNKGGGKKGKKGGRKHLTAPTQRGVRTVQEQGECYAAVTKLYGGCNCEVMCDDGVSRLCIIRNKFRGRGRRDNMLAPGKWVMVGIREWEARAAGKAQKCDLLEVYNDSDKKRLAKDHPGNWHILMAVDDTSTAGAPKEDDVGHVEFGYEEDDGEMDMEIQEEANASGKNSSVIHDLGDVIDIDDI